MAGSAVIGPRAKLRHSVVGFIDCAAWKYVNTWCKRRRRIAFNHEDFKSVIAITQQHEHRRRAQRRRLAMRRIERLRARRRRSRLTRRIHERYPKCKPWNHSGYG